MSRGGPLVVILLIVAQAPGVAATWELEDASGDITTSGFLSATDAYAQQVIDLCMQVEETLSGGEGTWVGLALDGKLRLETLLAVPTSSAMVDAPCCACGSHLGGPVARCWVNSVPCCCSATISPRGWLNCNCEKGVCGTGSTSDAASPSGVA